MEFTNTFTVAAPMERVWGVLTNAQEVAPCVPGAQITEMVDANHFKGTVKVKLGAVQMTYRGQMELTPDVAPFAGSASIETTLESCMITGADADTAGLRVCRHGRAVPVFLMAGF